MCEINNIPEMTDPAGRHWRQPDRSLIEFRDGAAYMPSAAFEKLLDYSGSQPSGIYAGKMWKSYHAGIDVWFLAWVTNDPNDCKKAFIYSRAIRIINESDETEPVDDRLPVWML